MLLGEKVEREISGKYEPRELIRALHFQLQYVYLWVAYQSNTSNPLFGTRSALFSVLVLVYLPSWTLEIISNAFTTVPEKGVFSLFCRGHRQLLNSAFLVASGFRMHPSSTTNGTAGVHDP